MYKYEAKLIEKIPEGIPLEDITVLESDKEWYGHSFGTCVGCIYDDGEKKSLFVVDGNGTEKFDKLLESGILKEKHKHTINRKTGRDRGVTYYYVMREIVGHSSRLPTITEQCLTTCCNVKYHYTYEILFVADDEYKRYVTVGVDTEGPYTMCLMDIVEGLEGTLEEWAEDEEYGFSIDESGVLYCKFFNDFGQSLAAEFNSLRELMMCVNSVRIVELQEEII